jgi:hypothetical protein
MEAGDHPDLPLGEPESLFKLLVCGSRAPTAIAGSWDAPAPAPDRRRADRRAASRRSSCR